MTAAANALYEIKFAVLVVLDAILIGGGISYEKEYLTNPIPLSYTHLRANETKANVV